MKKRINTQNTQNAQKSRKQMLEDGGKRLDFILEKDEALLFGEAMEKTGAKNNKDLVIRLLFHYLDRPFGAEHITEADRAAMVARLHQMTPAKYKHRSG